MGFSNIKVYFTFFLSQIAHGTKGTYIFAKCCQKKPKKVKIGMLCVRMMWTVTKQAETMRTQMICELKQHQDRKRIGAGQRLADINV